MKKLSLFVVLLGVMAAILIACGGAATSTPQPAAVAATTAPAAPEAMAATTASAATTAPAAPEAMAATTASAATTAPAATGKMLTSIDTSTVATTVVPAPAQYSESPMLAKLVAEGKLPPVEERLPDTPLVLQVNEVGMYGGELRRVHLGPADANCNVGRFNGRGLGRWSGDGLGTIPNSIKSFESNADGSVWTVHLLPGMKWSDGNPLTAEDFLYAYEVETNPDLKAQPNWIRSSGDPIVQVVKIDDYTVEFRYSRPYYFFPRNLAFSCTNRDMQYRPAHYLKQFDANHNPDAQKNAEAAGYETWQQFYMFMEDPRDNPDRPVTAAWVWTNTRAEDPIRLSRNPYYPIVDQEGNQLPYIDTVRFSSAAGGEVLNLRAAQGEIDFQGRHINFSNFAVLKDGEERGNYRIRMVPDPQGSDVMLIFNLTYRGPEGVLIGNKDWRIAMAYSIDRDSINEITMGGQGIVRNALPSADIPYIRAPTMRRSLLPMSQTSPTKCWTGSWVPRMATASARYLTGTVSSSSLARWTPLAGLWMGRSRCARTSGRSASGAGQKSWNEASWALATLPTSSCREFTTLTLTQRYTTVRASNSPRVRNLGGPRIGQDTICPRVNREQRPPRTYKI